MNENRIATNEFVLGIDLGTTTSCVVVYRDGKPKVIETGLGPSNSNIVPSVVAFPDTELNKSDTTPKVGVVALNQMMINPKRTLYEVKRLMGRSLKDIEDSDADKGWIKSLPYKVVPKDGDPTKQACIDVPGAGIFEPRQIAARILQSIVEAAREKLSIPKSAKPKVVITVPAYFNNQQREATKEAGEIAGLEVLRVINEPTAAAIAYGIENKHKTGTVVVYDMGGGTFDVSILKIEAGADGAPPVFEVKSTRGDTHLGGADFDRKIIDFITQKIREQLGFEITEAVARQRTRDAAEKAKRDLSNLFEVEISLPFIGPKGEHFQCKLTRAQFEEMTSELIEKRAGDCCKQALKDAGIGISDVDEVVLVGGMTRMSKIVNWVQDFFGKNPCRDVNPDEVVAIGACIQASTITGVTSGAVLVLDVTPLSLGVETLGGISTVLIPRNTTIPTNKTEVFSTAADNQPQVEIKVLQGERQMAADNKVLGNFSLVGIKPAPRGVPQIEVTFAIDANGILTVTAKDKATGNSQDLAIESSNQTPKEEIEEMQRLAKEHEKEDAARRAFAEQKNVSQVVYHDAKKLLDVNSDKLDKNLGIEIHKSLEELQLALSGEDKDKLQKATNAVSGHIVTLKKLQQDDASKTGKTDQKPPSNPNSPRDDVSTTAYDSDFRQ